MCYFPIQQWPCHDSIVTDKGLNLFDDCAAKCVYLCPQEEKCSSSSWGHSEIYTPGTIANSDRQCANWNKQKWCFCQSKNFSRTRDTIRHLKIFRVISNEMPVLHLILCWCYFSCLKMYSEEFLNAFMRKCFLKSLCERKTQFSIFWKIIAWALKFSLTKLHVSWRSWF